jgi:hypothetical protein
LASPAPAATDNLGVLAALSGIGAFVVGLASAIGSFVASAIRDARIETRLLAIVDLRRAGVVLRNHGMDGVTTTAQLAGWLTEFDKWHQSAVAAVSKLSKQEGENFKTLDKWKGEDVLTPKSGGYLDAKHGNSVHMLTAWLRVLNEIRERYSR